MPPETARDQALRARLEDEPDIVRVTDRFDELLARADIASVQAAIAAGDGDAISEALGVAREELGELIGTLLERSGALRAQFGPELGRYGIHKRS